MSGNSSRDVLYRNDKCCNNSLESSEVMSMVKKRPCQTDYKSSEPSYRQQPSKEPALNFQDPRKPAVEKKVGTVVLKPEWCKDRRGLESRIEQCPYQTRCYLCKDLVQRIRSLLDEIKTIRKNVTTVAVCEICKRCNTLGKCRRCEYLQDRYRISENIEDDARQQRFKIWLCKVKQFLYTILERETCKHKVYPKTPATDELTNLLHELKSPLTIREPDIGNFPSIDSLENITESKDILEEVLMRLKSDKRSEDYMSQSSHFKKFGERVSEIELSDQERSVPSPTPLFRGTVTENLIKQYSSSKTKEMEPMKSLVRLSKKEKGKKILPNDRRDKKYGKGGKYGSNGGDGTYEQSRRDEMNGANGKYGKGAIDGGDRKLGRSKKDRADGRHGRREMDDIDGGDERYGRGERDGKDGGSGRRAYNGKDVKYGKDGTDEGAERHGRGHKDGEGGKYGRDEKHGKDGNIAVNGRAGGYNGKDGKHGRGRKPVRYGSDEKDERYGRIDKDGKSGKDARDKKHGRDGSNGGSERGGSDEGDGRHGRRGKDGKGGRDEKLGRDESNGGSGKGRGYNEKDEKHGRGGKQGRDKSGKGDERQGKGGIGEKYDKGASDEKGGKDGNFEIDGIYAKVGEDKKLVSLKGMKDAKEKLGKEPGPDMIKFTKMELPKESKPVNPEKLPEMPKIGDLPLPTIKLKTVESSSGSYIECDVNVRECNSEMIKGSKIVPIEPRTDLTTGSVQPILFKAFPEYLDPNGVVSSTDTSGVMTDKKEQDNKSSRGVVRYMLSNREFIDKGWTLLPTTKIMRRMNIYKMKPANPKMDWFLKHKDQIIFYDTGEKLAEIEKDGSGKLFYKNGNVALAYYCATEANIGSRYVVYSSGENTDAGKKLPVTVLALFDFQGNGVVYDHYGNERLKYNQSEGIVIDDKIGSPGRWKWHTLNEPPVLQTVYADVHVRPNQCLEEFFRTRKDEDLASNQKKEPNLEMLAIELENFLKEKAQALLQEFKPFQIRMKALKINEQFSLKVIDQASINLLFRDGKSAIKFNLGMLLISNEIIDTDIAEVTQVATPYDHRPAKSDSIVNIQGTLERARKLGKARGKLRN